MNTSPNAMPESAVDAKRITPAESATRPMYWSVRRELWENRWIYLAPLLVAATLLVALATGMVVLSRQGPRGVTLDPARLQAAVAVPLDLATRMILLTAFMVGVFYCIDALHGERRDRSILFWKSLPVSDLTTVLSKASIPLVVLPLLTFAVLVATHLIMLALGAAGLMMRGASATSLWPLLASSLSPLAVMYALAATALWHAPLYGWLLLVSGWARRAPILWAVLPWVAINVVERIAFGSSHVLDLLTYRGLGWYAQAYAIQGQAPVGGIPLTRPTPGEFLGTSGLWIGLAVAAACLAAAVRLRRYRDPI